MTRNTLFTLIFLVLIAGLIGMGAYFYYSTSKTAGPGKNFGEAVREFLPFGKPPGEEGARPPETGVPETGFGGETAGGREVAPRLMKLVQNPVAGFVSTTIGSTTLVRYAEKETGRVYEIDLSVPSAKNKITNTTVPKIYRAFFGKDGSSILLRYLDGGETIQTYFAKIPAATTTEAISEGVALRGSFLSPNIADISASLSSLKIFTLTGFGNSAVGVVSDPDGSKKAQIFDSPLTEWLSSWVNDKTILLSTKPSYAAAGYIYSLDSKSGAMKKIYGGTYGLTALMSPDEKTVLIGENDSPSRPSAKIYRVSEKSLSETGLATMADKCVWAGATVVYCAVPNQMPPVPGGYPDAWYQGIAAFSDAIWRIDTETVSVDQVSDVSNEAREGIDAVNLALNKNADHIFFINKRNGSLWVLRLTP